MNEFKNEQSALESNLTIYFSLIDFLRDSVEIFFIIRRQKEKKIFEEDQCNDLIKYLTKARYNLGELIEDIRLFEKNLGENVFLK